MNQNTNYDPDKFLKEYNELINNPPAEVLARFGGIEGWRREVKRQNRENKISMIKSNIRVRFRLFSNKALKVAYILLVIYLINYFFF